MAIAGALREGGAVSRTEHGFAIIFDKCQLAFEHVHEFVFFAVPVALARPASWWQRHQVDTEVMKTSGGAESLPHASRTRGRKQGRIPRTQPRRHGIEINLRHADDHLC